MKGAFFGDWLGIAVVLFIIAWIGLKFGSVYLDHYGARAQIEELQSIRSDQAETAEEVRQQLAKRLQLNNLNARFRPNHRGRAWQPRGGRNELRGQDLFGR